MKCRVKDIDVHYEIVGNGRPILMLHGYWIDHHSMVGAMEPIFSSQNGWQRIYIDLPGMGQTPGAAWITSSDQMLDVVDEFVAQVIGDASFAVAGLSYGAYIARGLLHRRFAQINGLFLFAPIVDPEQSDPHRLNHHNTTAERLLRFSVDVPAPVADVWHAWTTEAGAKTFFASACKIDLRVGGAYEMYFAPDAPEGERGGDGLTILAIQPEKMLSFTWNAPPSLPDVRGQHTAVTIRLYPLFNNQTRVTLIHTGWGEGGQWDDAFAYFAAAWGDVILPRLQQRFASGPVSWS